MSNYKCFVAKISSVIEITGADKIHTAIVLGEQVVVSKDWGVGKVGLFFPADTKLSEEFCKNNNLFRNSNLNLDKEKKGFFDENRRVRCQPFLKVRSEGFFCSTDALDYTSHKELVVGESFDTVNGKILCEKYVSEATQKALNNAAKNKKKTATKETPMFAKHVDSAQFRQMMNIIQKGDLLSFHAKIHGTSSRNSYSKVITKPVNLWQKLLNMVGLFKEEKWTYLTGTRNVVLHEDQYKEGFHGSEQFRFDVMEILKPYLDKGMTVYGEIAGYANGKPIMSPHSTKGLKDKKFSKKYGNEIIYKYGCAEHEFRFHVYRISMTNEDGVEVDLSDQQVKTWCLDKGILSTVDVHPPMIFDGDMDKLVDLVEGLTDIPDKLTEDVIDPSHISEGIIVRVDKGGFVPKFLKNKSYAFKVAEGILKESGDLDLEESS